MNKASIVVKRKLVLFLFAFVLCVVGLIIRIGYIQTVDAEWLQEMAREQQTRDRLIAPKRGSILDRNGAPIAETRSVCSISIIPVQARADGEMVAQTLAELLDMDYDTIYEKTQNRVALERVKSKVDKELANEIRALNLPGVVVDEDVKRVYPYENLASQVVGFVGRDNQGIIGLESKYEEYLKGQQGKILTETDAKGINLPGKTELREEPVDGYHLQTTIDINIQQYAEQTIQKAVEAKNAKKGAIIVMNPQTGEVYAMAIKPDFNLNDPFTINDDALAALWDQLPAEEQNDALNQMWRNFTINDTYEPGSTFKIITSAAALEEGVVDLDSQFNCSGFYTVADRMIKCWRYPRAHGAETFLEGVQNSCNPVFMILAERLGAEKFYDYMALFGFKDKTGIDLPGEAVGIMHNLDNVGPVELATMSFGQSFQITPMQLLKAASCVVNGGYMVTPHVAAGVVDDNGDFIEEFVYDKGERVLSEETSEKMKYILESVVAYGTGNKTYLPGYRVGGKTATSEKLPRKNGNYIASFMAFAPAEDPQVIALVIIDEPEGVYYGGQVAGPYMKELFENILPYLGIEPSYSEEELNMENIGLVTVPDVTGLDVDAARKELSALSLSVEVKGDGEAVTAQFPLENEQVNIGSKMIIYTQ